MERTREIGSTNPPEWADHSLVVDEERNGDRVEYHLVTSGRVESIDTESVTRNGGAFGHAEGTARGGRHAFYFRGRLLSIKLRPSLVELDTLDHEDPPFEVRIDGNPIDYERWDPSRGDLPLGYGGVDALPEDLAVDRSDTDRVVSTREELLVASEELGDGAVVGVTADIDLPEGAGVPLDFEQDDLTVVGLETDDGTYPTLSRDRVDDGWGHVAFRLAGDRATVSNLQFRGPLDHYVSDRDGYGKIRGVVLAGDDGVVLNCHGWNWSHAAFFGGGEGATFLCVDAHHNMLDGLGYGIASSGPIGQPEDGTGDRWSAAELAEYEPWHRRTEIQRALFDANRHDVAAGTHASYELRRFVVGPRAVTGTRIDQHRPGGGIVAVSHGILERPDRGHTGDVETVHGFWMRGWPEVGCRLERVWFAWGEEPDLGHRYPGPGAPIVQVCATDDTRDRRRIWDTADGPFVGVEWHDCAFGPEEPDWLPRELRTARTELERRF